MTKSNKKGIIDMIPNKDFMTIEEITDYDTKKSGSDYNTDLDDYIFEGDNIKYQSER